MPDLNGKEKYLLSGLLFNRVFHIQVASSNLSLGVLSVWDTDRTPQDFFQQLAAGGICLLQMSSGRPRKTSSDVVNLSNSHYIKCENQARMGDYPP